MGENAALHQEITRVFNNVIVGNFSQILKGAEIVSVDDGSCKMKLVLTKEHLNHNGSLHGGFTATLLDIVSMIAMRTKKLHGVTVGLSVNFIAPAKEGQKVIIDGKVLKVGKNLGFLSAEIRDEESNKLIAQGQQSAYIITVTDSRL